MAEARQQLEAAKGRIDFLERLDNLKTYEKFVALQAENEKLKTRVEEMEIEMDQMSYDLKEVGER